MSVSRELESASWVKTQLSSRMYGFKKNELFGESLNANTDREKILDIFFERFVPRDSGKYSYRYAQSLVSRVDAELFGVSGPRFALRVYRYYGGGSPIEKPRLRGFINLRRSWTLKNNAKWLVAAERHEVTGKSGKKISPNTKIASFPLPYVQGDGILQLPPTENAGKYFVIQAPFSYEFGDCESIVGTPFIGYCTVTGACVPAVCFIAVMLLKEYGVSAIHSLPEIARKLTKDEFENHVVIESANVKQVVDYCREINLGAQLQSCDAESQEPCRIALRSYIKSGFPVILQVDSYRMHGIALGNAVDKFKTDDESIYSRNVNKKTGFIKSDVSCSDIKPNPHAVIAVGCGNRIDSQDFIIHDPQYLPFLKADISSIFNARGYVKQSIGSKNSQLSDDLFFVPITPSAVSLPLCSPSYPTNDRLGLFEIIRRCRLSSDHNNQAFRKFIFNGEWPSNGEPSNQDNNTDRGVFNLTRKDGVLRYAGLTQFTNINDILSPVKDDWWIWIQELETHVVLWDAQCQPPPSENGSTLQDTLEHLGKCLIAVGNRQEKAMQCSIEWAKRQQHLAPDCIVPVDAPSPALRAIENLAIISSASTLMEFPQDKNELAKKEKILEMEGDIELYAFMKDHLKMVCQVAEKHQFQFDAKLCQNTATAVEIMSALADADLVIIQAICARIKEEFPNKKIRSMSTFCPEILSPEESRRKNGQRALQFACQLLYELVRVEEQKIGYLEMVAGGCCQSVWPGINDEGNDVLVAEYLSKEDQKKRLLECLEKLAQTFVVNSETDKVLDRIYLAIEIEPGELFAYGEEGGIDRLLSDITDFENNERIPRNRIGLNLDIAHWMILFPSGVPASWDSKHPVYQRIVHAHITDGFFHLADAPIASGSPTAEKKKLLQEWINFLKRRCHDNDANRFMQYSGFASVELECACCAKCIENAFLQAKKFLIEESFFDS